MSFLCIVRTSLPVYISKFQKSDCNKKKKILTHKTTNKNGALKRTLAENVSLLKNAKKAINSIESYRCLQSRFIVVFVDTSKGRSGCYLLFFLLLL